MSILLSGSGRTEWNVDDDRGFDRMGSGHSNGTGEVKKLWCCPEKKTAQISYAPFLTVTFHYPNKWPQP